MFCDFFLLFYRFQKIKQKKKDKSEVAIIGFHEDCILTRILYLPITHTIVYPSTLIDRKRCDTNHSFCLCCTYCFLVQWVACQRNWNCRKIIYQWDLCPENTTYINKNKTFGTTRAHLVCSVYMNYKSKDKWYYFSLWTWIEMLWRHNFHYHNQMNNTLYLGQYCSPQVSSCKFHWNSKSTHKVKIRQRVLITSGVGRWC